MNSIIEDVAQISKTGLGTEELRARKGCESINVAPQKKKKKKSHESLHHMEKICQISNQSNERHEILPTEALQLKIPRPKGPLLIHKNFIKISSQMQIFTSHEKNVPNFKRIL